MELFNSLIRETNALLDKGSPKAWDYSPDDTWKDIGSSELVLQKDAAFELGASGRGSANYVLFTSSPELVNRDQVLLYGPDLKEIRGDVDRIGQTRRTRTLLGVEIPNIIIPVSEGRDLVNLVETAAQQQKLIMAGNDPVARLSERLHRRAETPKAEKWKGKRHG